jgi:xylose isomerase
LFFALSQQKAANFPPHQKFVTIYRSFLFNASKEKRMANYQPLPEHKFTFGLWTIANAGRDPFGDAVRKSLSPVEIVHLVAEAGAYGVNFHDNDLVPINATAAEEAQIMKEFKKALSDTGIVVPMATTNLFYHPIFRDGAFTSNDPKVRAYALQKTMHSMDLGAELGAKVYVFWGGREGTDTDAGKSALDAGKWFRDALNFLCEYNIDQGYGYKFALEPKPNEPRGDLYLPTTGAMLGFIATLDHPCQQRQVIDPEVPRDTSSLPNREIRPRSLPATTPCRFAIRSVCQQRRQRDPGPDRHFPQDLPRFRSNCQRHRAGQDES